VAPPTPLLFAIAQQLHDGVAAELAAVETAGGSPVPARSGIVHGEPTVEDCCDGMLWCRWVSEFLTDDFPNEVGTWRACESLVAAAVYEVGVMRCVPTVETKGQGRVKLPTAEALQASALELAIDAAALMRGVYATARAWKRDRLFVIDSLQPTPEEGQCGGSFVTLTVQLR